MEQLITVLASAGVSGLLSSALVWIFRSWISERLKSAIQHEYSEKLETHKAQLKAESDIAVEQLRSQLHIAAVERNIQYSKVFEKTAEMIAEINLKLFGALRAVDNYTTLFQGNDKDEQSRNRLLAAAAINDFTNYYQPRKLYLPKSTTQKLDEFIKKLQKASFDFMFFIEQGREKRYPERDIWTEVNEIMTSEIPSLMKTLEDDFRSVLGTHSNEP